MVRKSLDELLLDVTPAVDPYLLPAITRLLAQSVIETKKHSMKLHSVLSFAFRPIIVTVVTVICCQASINADERPNVLIIVADDLGYADLGFQGCTDIATPHLDALAKNGAKCTDGYVTHPFCSPTRAGLLVGRYQQRFGHENNPKWLPDSLTDGLPLSETTIAEVMRSNGYETGCIGKWHMGAHPQFHPNKRGFDHYFGALGGGHVYLDGLKGGVEYTIPMDRNGSPEPLKGYITTLFGNEASKFIKKERSQPWLLYLAFNAPHTPLQSTPELQERVKHILDRERRDLAALIVGLDDAIGDVMSALKSSGQFDNTLIFFFSDNGGPISVSKCFNTPLRAGKGSLYEGGIRIPFVVSWPKKIAPGTVYRRPVISLDVFSTAVAVANAKTTATSKLEGTNIVPYLSGERTDSPHTQLFWRTGGGGSYAVREGSWKLFGQKGKPSELYDLARDIGENHDVAAMQPDVLARLEKSYADWNRANVSPLFESPKAARKK